MKKTYNQPSLTVQVLDPRDMIVTSGGSGIPSGEGDQPNKADARGRNSIWDE